MDFQHTPEAQQKRAEKARQIARHLYETGVTVAAAGWFTADERRDVVHAAGVRPASDETWALAVDLLRERLEWDRRHSVTSPVMAVPTLPPDPQPPVPVIELVPDLPSGPPCNHWADGGYCGRTDTRHYISGHRCPAHTPAALAGKPEPAPDPGSTLNALRARAGIRVDFSPPAVETVIDAQAKASGKRRASPEAYRAAREQVARAAS